MLSVLTLYYIAQLNWYKQLRLYGRREVRHIVLGEQCDTIELPLNYRALCNALTLHTLTGSHWRCLRTEVTSWSYCSRFIMSRAVASCTGYGSLQCSSEYKTQLDLSDVTLCSTSVMCLNCNMITSIFLLNRVSELHLLLVVSNLPHPKFGALYHMTSNLLPLSPRSDPDSKFSYFLQLINNR